MQHASALMSVEEATTGSQARATSYTYLGEDEDER